jgi:hypothetical protein
MPPSNLTNASSRAITRPPCPKCGTTMVLARVEPIERRLTTPTKLHNTTRMWETCTLTA